MKILLKLSFLLILPFLITACNKDVPKDIPDWLRVKIKEIKKELRHKKIAESIPYDTDVSVQQAILDYHRVVSEYMRDSLHSNQLIGADMGLDSVFSESVATLPKIDVIGLNMYYGGPADVYDKIAHKLNNARNTLMIDKPFIFSEGGLDEEYQLCSNFTQYPIDVMTYPFTGAAGYFTWNGWRDNEHYLQASAIRANYHTNGEDVINTLSEGGGYWTQNGSEVELKTFGERYKLIEQQYYISTDKKMAVGYVKNRTFNYFTRSNSFQCSVLLTDMTIGYILPLSILWNSPPLNKRLQLTNLNHGKKYRIDWYSVFSSQNNGYLKTDNVTATLGKITLKYPPLIVTASSSQLDRPAVWYVLRQVDEFERPMQDSDTNFISLDKRMISEIILDKNENNGNELNANIYPNPFHSELIVTSLEDDEFIIITPTGNIVLQQRVLKGINNVSIKHLPKGFYFGKLVNQQFIIKLEQL